MAYRRRSFRTTRKPVNYEWSRTVQNNASPNATLNTIDLLATFRTHAGITINLPEYTIWGIRVRVTIKITLASTAGASDGVLVTCFVDSINQTMLNQLSQPWDEHDLLFSYIPMAPEFGPGVASPAGDYLISKEYVIKARRKLQSLDDTVYLQLAASGNAVIASYSIAHVELLRRSR